ncbi:MAG: caspase family protein [Nostoc sp.]|uniref:nSTAND1 domain-containing NTPase n=1 Tax=Nostoc sp. TaxID=1180 RepID=UPI002FF44F93
MARYALVLGIAKYDNFTNLPKAVNDAEQIAQLLREQGRFDVQPLPGKLIESENRWEITPDKKLTGKELGLALRIFLLEKAKGAEALIYFAGHGFEAPSLTGIKKGYLATSDCNKEGQNAITFDELNTLISESQLSSLVVLLDCCYAGSLLERSFIRSGFSVFNSKQDYCLITASRAFERAREDAEGGIFTKAVIKGLAEDKADETTGEINANDLMSFVSRELKGSGQEAIYMGGGRSISLVWYPPKNPVALSVVSEESPYRGLQAFDKEHAKFFFGRQKVVSLIQQKLTQANFLPIIGASGSGKSSVVRAGLIPVLEKNGWRILEPILPGVQPLAELKRAFTQLFERTEIREISAFIDTEGLSTVIYRLTGSERCLLVVDQFEEIFTLGSQEEERQRFIELLTQVSQGQLAIVTTMRADFLEYCLNYKSLTQLIQEQAVYMPPLVGAELEEAIASPANLQGYQLERGLLGTIQQEVVGQEKGCLPLLQFALTELWEQRDRQAHQLTVAKFKELGGVIGALERHAEKLYVSFTEQPQAWVKRIFLKLVRTGAEGKDTRQRQPKQELLSLAREKPDEEQVIKQVIEKLIQGRLIVTYTEAKEEVWIDLAHEALIDGWRRLREWRQQDRDLRQLSDRLADALQEWLHKEEDEKYLMPRGLLAEVQKNWEKLKPDLSSPAQKFYQRSVAYEQHQIATLEKALTESRLREKAARVLNLLTVKPLDSLLLAIQSMGENREQMPDKVLNTVLTCLHRVIEIVRVPIPLEGHKKSVTSVAFSPDGKMIASGSLDNKVRLWNIQGNSISNPFCGHKNSVWSVAFSPDGKMIASGSYDETVRLWNLQGKPIGQPFIGHKNAVWSVAFSLDGQMIVSASSDRTVRLWNLHGEPIGQPLQGHEDNVCAVAFSPDGKMIVSGSNDKTVRLWNLHGEPIGQPFQGHEDNVCAVAFSPDGKMIVSGSNDKTLRLWNLENILSWEIQGHPTGQPFWGHEDTVYSVAFSPDGQQIVSSSNDNTIRLWNLQGQLNSEALSGQNNSIFKENSFWSVAFSPDGQQIVSSGDHNKVLLWDIKSYSVGQPFRGHQNYVTSVAVSPNGQMIVTASDDSTVRLWDIQGNPIGDSFFGHEHYVLTVAFSPNGQIIASSGCDGTVRLWNLQGNLIAPPFQGDVNSVGAVAFSLDGKMIVTGNNNGTIRLWDLEGNPIAQPFRGHECLVNSVAFSPDGQMIVSGSWDDTVRLWDLQGNLIGQPLQGHENYVNSVAFSPDGQMIVSGSWDKTVRLWDLQGNPICQPFQGHEDYVNSVAFSPDGQMIVSGSRDNTVRLWDIEGRLIGQPLRGHTNCVRAVTFSPDGQTIISGSHDKTVRLWRVGWRICLEVCCNRLRYHPIFTNPQTEEAKAACEVCRKYVWSEEEVKSGD